MDDGPVGMAIDFDIKDRKVYSNFIGFPLFSLTLSIIANNTTELNKQYVILFTKMLLIRYSFWCLHYNIWCVEYVIYI